MPTADLSARRGCLADLATYPRAVMRFYDPRGRSTRTELFMLIAVPAIVLALLSPLLLGTPLASALGKWVIALPIVILAPVPASAARRFHDAGKNGWLALPVLLICAVAVWDVWKDLQAGPGTSHDLFGNNPIADAIFGGICLLYVFALLQPPRDVKNPYGPSPRPAPKVI